MFVSNHSFLGFVEREYTVEPNSAEKVFEEFEFFLDALGLAKRVALVSILTIRRSEPDIEDRQNIYSQENGASGLRF